MAVSRRAADSIRIDTRSTLACRKVEARAFTLDKPFVRPLAAPAVMGAGGQLSACETHGSHHFLSASSIGDKDRHAFFVEPAVIVVVQPNCPIRLRHVDDPDSSVRSHHDPDLIGQPHSQHAADRSPDDPLPISNPLTRACCHARCLREGSMTGPSVSCPSEVAAAFLAV